MDEPLVDDQDFPRNDIDVYQIRLIRNRIICKYLLNVIIVEINYEVSISPIHYGTIR